MSNPEKYFQDYKNEESNSGIESLSSWLEQTSKIKNASLANNRPALLKVISLNKAKFASFLALIMIFYLGNYPVSKTKTVGYVYSFTVPKENLNQVNNNIDNIDWFNKSSLTMQEIDSQGKKFYNFKVIFDNPVDTSIVSKKMQLQNLAQNVVVEVMPIASTVKIPAYSAALNSVFNYNYVPKIINTDEFENKIYEQVKYAGVQNAVITVREDKYGNAFFTIEVPNNRKINVDSIKRKVNTLESQLNSYDDFAKSNYETPNSETAPKILIPSPPNKEDAYKYTGIYGTDGKNIRQKYHGSRNYNYTNAEYSSFDNYEGNIIIEMPDRIITFDGKNNTIEFKDRKGTYTIAPGEIIIKPGDYSRPVPPPIPPVKETREENDDE